MLTAQQIRELIKGGNDWLERMERQDRIAHPDQPPSDFCIYCGIPKQEMVAKVNDIAQTALELYAKVEEMEKEKATPPPAQEGASYVGAGHEEYEMWMKRIEAATSRAREEERERIRNIVKGLEMPKWNGCYDERCKDRSCNLCLEWSQIAQRDKAHILSALDEGK